MARGRMINKRLCKSKKFAQLKNDRSRVLYVLMYTNADCEGRFTGDPEDIKIECCPYLNYSVNKIAESVIDLANVDLINLYEVNGKPYIEFIDFEENQPGLRKDREAPSDIPPAELQTNSDITPSLYLKLNLSLREDKERKINDKIYFSFDERKWKNISENDLELWKKTYSACDVDYELMAMGDWLLSNPSKKKSNYRAFISRWLRKQQDQGGTKGKRTDWRKKRDEQAKKIEEDES